MHTLMDFWICKTPMTSTALKSSDIRLYLRDIPEKKCSQSNHILISPPCQVWKPRGYDVGTIINIWSILALQITAPHFELSSHRKPVAVHTARALCQLPPRVSFSLRALLFFVPCTLSGNKENRGSKKSKDEGVIRYFSWRKDCVWVLSISYQWRVHSTWPIAETPVLTELWHAQLTSVLFSSILDSMSGSFPNTSGCHFPNSPRKLLQFLIPSLKMGETEPWRSKVDGK